MPAVLLDNAYIEGQRAGKTPALCRPDASFMVYEEACDTRVKERKDNLPNTNGQKVFHPLIAPYVGYCSSANSTVPQPSTITVPGATLTTALAVSADPVSSRLVTTNVVIPFELSDHSTVVTEQTTYMSYAPVSTTAVLTQPAIRWMMDGLKPGLSFSLFHVSKSYSSRDAWLSPSCSVNASISVSHSSTVNPTAILISTNPGSSFSTGNTEPDMGCRAGHWRCGIRGISSSDGVPAEEEEAPVCTQQQKQHIRWDSSSTRWED
ncbi:hypothetical protein PG993_005715 [Apiospora rasikravindrae]|uniref:Uncharacterized protein n=1 Tax=Apiospora rasikravindrae TaxID=990691 RepID=A0ABR1T9L1_9PEZI